MWNLQQNILFLPTMKFLSVIVSIVILVVSLVPCPDNLIVKRGSSFKKEITSSNSSNEHNGTSDNCSPFCTCSCCTASAIYYQFSKSQVEKVIFQSEKYPLYNISFSTEVFYSIWQPPKLSWFLLTLLSFLFPMFRNITDGDDVFR